MSISGIRPSHLAVTGHVHAFRRNLDSNLEENVSWRRLREEVVSAVEAEVRSQLSEYEISDEDYVSVSRNAWSRFYSCAAQYRASGELC